MGVVDPPDLKPFPAKVLLDLELFFRIHFITDRGVEGVFHRNHAGGPSSRRRRDQPTAFFRVYRSGVGDDFFVERTREYQVRQGSIHQIEQAQSVDPLTEWMDGWAPHRGQFGSLGTLTFRKVIARAS